MKHGMVDMIVPRKELKGTIARLLKMMLKLPEGAATEAVETAEAPVPMPQPEAQAGAQA
jgi:acetyl-CoA carboxylase carboxyl transferase subunit beta